MVVAAEEARRSEGVEDEERGIVQKSGVAAE